MATKQDICNSVVAILEAAAVETEVITSVEDILKPKTGGKALDLSEVTRVDEDGNIVEMECAVSHVWLPATAEYFYEDKTGKGPNGLKRTSKQGEGVKKAFLKTHRASEKAIMADFTSGDIEPDEAKELLADLENQAPDYTVVGLIVEEVEETEEA